MPAKIPGRKNLLLVVLNVRKKAPFLRQHINHPKEMDLFSQRHLNSSDDENINIETESC